VPGALVNFPFFTPRVMALSMESGKPSISVSISAGVRGPFFSSWAASSPLACELCASGVVTVLTHRVFD
jgi:hypothetical protein